MHGDVDPVRDAAAVVMADVRPFDADDPGILPEFPGELAVADVDGIDLRCPRLEEAVGEAAGGGPDVEGDQALDGKAEGIEGAPEFEAAPADIGVLFAPDPDLRIGGDQASRLVHRPVADQDRPGEDQRLRPLPALRQAPRDEQLIEAVFASSSLPNLWGQVLISRGLTSVPRPDPYNLPHRGGDSLRIDPVHPPELLLGGLRGELIRDAEASDGNADDPLFREEFEDGAAEASHQGILLDGDDSLELPRGAAEELRVEGFDEPGVDDPDGNSFGLKHPGGGQGRVAAVSDGNHGGRRTRRIERISPFPMGMIRGFSSSGTPTPVPRG